jgi:hypothetical protein
VGSSDLRRVWARALGGMSSASRPAPLAGSRSQLGERSAVDDAGAVASAVPTPRGRRRRAGARVISGLANEMVHELGRQVPKLGRRWQSAGAPETSQARRVSRTPHGAAEV